MWYYIPPPYDMKDAIPLDAPPIGARFTDSRSPYETIQMIGDPGATVPREVVKDLGWADIRILDGHRIEFVSGGLKTNVGTRIPKTTKGIEMEAGGGPVETEPDEVAPVEGAPTKETSTEEAPIEPIDEPTPIELTPVASTPVKPAPAKPAVVAHRRRRRHPVEARPKAERKAAVAGVKGELIGEPDEELLKPIAHTLRAKAEPPRGKHKPKKEKPKRKELTGWEYTTTLKGYDPYTGRGA